MKFRIRNTTTRRFLAKGSRLVLDVEQAAVFHSLRAAQQAARKFPQLRLRIEGPSEAAWSKFLAENRDWQRGYMGLSGGAIEGVDARIADDYAL